MKDEFDLLVEQKDQEIARDGFVSPYTQAQLQAHANGEPVPQVDVRSPEMQALTARLFRNVRSFRLGISEDDDEEEGWA